jgi:hypothetical protein
LGSSRLREVDRRLFACVGGATHHRFKVCWFPYKKLSG